MSPQSEPDFFSAASASLEEPTYLPPDVRLHVVEPRQQHLGLTPVLIPPGKRCVIGRATEATLRVDAEGVEPVHCVLVAGPTSVTLEQVSGPTWVNDRLTTQKRTLAQGDRIAMGPAEFDIRLATANERQRVRQGLSPSLANLEQKASLLTESDREETTSETEQTPGTLAHLHAEVRGTLEALKLQRRRIEEREQLVEQTLRRQRASLLRRENDLAIEAALLRERQTEQTPLQVQIPLPLPSQHQDDAAIEQHWEQRLADREDALYRRTAELQTWEDRLFQRERQLERNEEQVELLRQQIELREDELQREQSRVELLAKEVSNITAEPHRREELLHQANKLRSQLRDLL